MRTLPSGYLALTWFYLQAECAVQWMNPVWEVTELDINSEHDQVIHRLKATMDQLPPIDGNFSDVSDASLATGDVPIVVGASFERHIRHISLLAARVAELIWKILGR